MALKYSKKLQARGSKQSPKTRKCSEQLNSIRWKKLGNELGEKPGKVGSSITKVAENNSHAYR